MSSMLGWPPPQYPPLLSQLPPLLVCRDAASAELEVHALEEAQAACLRVNQLGERPDVYGPLAERLRHISEWLKQRASVGLKDQGREFHEGVWAGQQVCSGLAVLRIHIPLPCPDVSIPFKGLATPRESFYLARATPGSKTDYLV